MKVNKRPVAVICLSPNSGGMEMLAMSFAQKLQNNLSDVKVISIVKKDSYMNNTLKEQNELTYETIDFYKTFSFSIITNARKIIKKYKIKNVIFFGASEMKSLYFAFLGLDINLIIRHSTTKSTSKKDWFHRLIYSDVNYHIGTSQHLVNNIREIIPFGTNSKANLIASSFEFQSPFHVAHNKLTLLHTGRIVEGKGQLDAIKACEILADNHIDFHFYVVGELDESYKDEFLTFYENCDYKNNVELVGFTNDVQSYIQKSDVFIFPSYGEGFGNSFMEALANNIVCISYANTSFLNFKEMGFYFKMCENRSIEDLKHNLLNVCLNLESELDKSSQNYKLASELLSVEVEMNKYIEILK